DAPQGDVQGRAKRGLTGAIVDRQARPYFCAAATFQVSIPGAVTFSTATRFVHLPQFMYCPAASLLTAGLSLVMCQDAPPFFVSSSSANRMFLQCGQVIALIVGSKPYPRIM